MNTTARTVLALLEKIVTILAVLSILVYMNVTAGMLGLEMLVNNGSIMAPVILGLLVVGCLLQKVSKSIHRRRIPMIVYIICAAVLVLTVFLSPNLIATYIFSALLFLTSVWNLLLEQRFSKSKVKTIKV